MSTKLGHRRLLSILVAFGAALLLVTPALARDKDPGHGDRDDHQVQASVSNEDEDRNEDRDADDNAAMMRTMRLVMAINNEVTRLSNVDLDTLDLDDMIKSISLSTLETGLTPDEATMVTNAVNANKDALQAFLSNGTDDANALDAALNDVGIAPSSVLAILPGRHHRFVVVTS